MLNLEALKTQAYQKIYVALSGGVDSCVLLHQLIQFKNLATSDFLSLNKIEAIYIDHQLSPNAKKWGAFCQQLCISYQIPFHTRTVNAQPEKQQSPEAAAREARYQAFMDIVELNDVLVTAHHLDDQAETFMLRLCRGSGVKGLSAMSNLAQYHGLTIFRPMLHISKQEIVEYAQQNQLSWITDESNNDCTYRRNFLRHKIFPAFEELWPSISKTLARVSQQQAEASLLLDELAEEDLNHCLSEARIAMVQYPIIDERKLLVLSENRIKNCIQYWLRKNKLPVLSAKLLEQLLIKLHQSNKLNMQLIVWKEPKIKGERKLQFGLYLYRNNLFVYRSNQSINYQQDLQLSYHLNLSHLHSIQLPNGNLHLINEQQLNEIKSTQVNVRLATVKVTDHVIIRYKQGTMDKELLDKRQRQRLKKFYQEQGIPECIRPDLPLIFINNELCQVGNQLFGKSLVHTINKSPQYLYFENI